MVCFADRLTAQKPEAPLESMIFIAGGRFPMGDNFGDGYSSERPVHSVTLKSFYLGRTELTKGEFRIFVEESGYATTAESADDENTWRDCQGIRQQDDHPVICVSWFDAVHYCNWRSKKEGLTPVYTISRVSVSANWNADGYRLPTEAEWEYAARSGGKLEKYAGAGSESQVDECAWHDENSGSSTHPVGQKRPNGLGLFDMSGNVLEWVWDRYGEYPSNAMTDPRGPEQGSTRILRGGSHSDNFSFTRAILRASYRGFEDPSRFYFTIGFRPARSAH